MRQAALGAAAARPAAPVRFVASVPACNHPHRRNPLYLRQHFQPGTTDRSPQACGSRSMLAPTAKRIRINSIDLTTVGPSPTCRNPGCTERGVLGTDTNKN